MHRTNDPIIMKIYKLKYTDKEIAITDLIEKEVIDKDTNYINGTQAVVDIGFIVSQDATFDEQGLQLTEPVFFEGYHYDLMSTDIIDFGANDIEVDNPKHTFMGY
jgi:hypothetical protein